MYDKMLRSIQMGKLRNVRQFIHDFLGYVLPARFTSRRFRSNNRFEKFSCSLLEPPVTIRVVWARMSWTKPRWFSIRHFAQFSRNGWFNLFFLSGYLSDLQACVLRPQ